MALTVLLGGARSGKSAEAQTLATALGRPVTYLATATPGDEEMAARITRHRSERPPEWTTLEEPIKLRDALAEIADCDTVIVDCLTLWLSNMMGNDESESSILSESHAAAVVAAARSGETIAVTNEVGLGVVPTTPMGRLFRDIAGLVNREWVEHANRTGFVVAGRVMPLLKISDWKETST
ncbi:MAG: hypothetical protein BMS9Abin12_1545 [Acidimicrobiia bacterium]|nr:MAG: hypothetical protein BMS9Abin12_1545 [Acidimicrobiia bacterium]